MNNTSPSWLITLFAFCLFLPEASFAQVELEDFFTCKSESERRGNTLARVYVDPQIFCSDQRMSEATLLLEEEGRSNLYNGKLLRWESGNGETFIYTKMQDEVEIETTLHLPYGIAAGILATAIDGDVIRSQELRCVTKQIHVDCGK